MAEKVKFLSIGELNSAVLDIIRANDLKEDIHGHLVGYLGGSGPVTPTSPIGMFVAGLPRGRKYDTTKGIRAWVAS